MYNHAKSNTITHQQLKILEMIYKHCEYVQLLEAAKAVSRRISEDILHTCCIARYACKFRFALAALRQSLLGGPAAARQSAALQVGLSGSTSNC
jgi:hypothetical protein